MAEYLFNTVYLHVQLFEVAVIWLIDKIQNHTVRRDIIAIFKFHVISFTRIQTSINMITERLAAFASITTSVPIFRILAFLSTVIIVESLRTITVNKHDLNGVNTFKQRNICSLNISRNEETDQHKIGGLVFKFFYRVTWSLY